VYWLVVSLWLCSSSSSVCVPACCLLPGYSPVVLVAGLRGLGSSDGGSGLVVYRGRCPGDSGSDCASVGGWKWKGGPQW